jgi:hypothetical protein
MALLDQLLQLQGSAVAPAGAALGQTTLLQQLCGPVNTSGWYAGAGCTEAAAAAAVWRGEGHRLACGGLTVRACAPAWPAATVPGCARGPNSCRPAWGAAIASKKEQHKYNSTVAHALCFA